MALLNPYLTFDGNAREAMETYREIFGGTLETNEFADYATGDGPAPEGLMHARLETSDGFTLMASDPPPGQPADPNGWISISGDEADKLRGYFERLSDGGRVVLPLEKQMWGDEFGQCVDRFGISWMVNISGA
jgi:PhnB protein